MLLIRDNMCVNPRFGYPCGRCHECLAMKVNSYVQKYFLEASARKSMHFFTLTYDNEHLPFKVWDNAQGKHYQKNMQNAKKAKICQKVPRNYAHLWQSPIP